MSSEAEPVKVPPWGSAAPQLRICIQERELKILSEICLIKYIV